MLYSKEKDNWIYFQPLILRLSVYFTAVIIPVFSSSIVVSYDGAGFAFWFIFIPLESVLAYIYSQTAGQGKSDALSGDILLKKQKKLFAAAVLLPLVFAFYPGFYPLLPRAAAFAAIILGLNILIFRSGIVSLVFIEPGFIYFIFYRILEFSRSSEAVWQSSSAMIPLLYILLVISYLFLSIVLYGSCGRGSLADFKKEILIFFAVILPLIAAAAIFIPADFMANDFILNFRDEKALSGRDGTDEDKDGNLSGVPSEKWGGRSRASGSSKQYAVMIVSTEENELYSAWEYLGGFNPSGGFIYIDEDYIPETDISEKNLNSLKNQRFLETWINPADDTEYRKEVPVFYLSAIPERVVPYLPAVIEPTIYSPESYPFSYSYNSVSMISPLSIKLLEHIDIKELSESEREKLALYLEIPLAEKHEKIFKEHLLSIGIEKADYNDKIVKLIKSFSDYQYELGYDEDSSVDRLGRFISKELTGDCTEFSNAAALLARLAGIPSRVVRGYLASHSLQSPSHTQALMMLQKSLDKIADIPPENLILVTTAHKHSWVQFYVPGFGWTDFETTEYAIPPEGGDPNSAQVVIPIIRGIREKPGDFIFPWKMLLSIMIVVLSAVISLLYLYKIFILSSLAWKSGKPVPVSFESRYRYILHRLFLAGYPVKTKTMTPAEYGEKNKDFSGFAALFTELLYRDVFAGNEYEELIENYRIEYEKLYKLTAPDSIKSTLKAVFSLRGVFY